MRRNQCLSHLFAPTHTLRTLKHPTLLTLFLEVYVYDQILCHASADGDAICVTGPGAVQGGPLAFDLFRESHDKAIDEPESDLLLDPAFTTVSTACPATVLC